jgi:molybdate transport repressor ModE-like protein
MSYRHAWGAIKKIEQRAGFRIVDTRLGGKDRGAQLTPRGKEFIEKADSVLMDLQKVVEKRFKKNFRKVTAR